MSMCVNVLYYKRCKPPAFCGHFFFGDIFREMFLRRTYCKGNQSNYPTI